MKQGVVVKKFTAALFYFLNHNFSLYMYVYDIIE